MPVLDIDPGQSPEAPGTLFFYEQGQDPLSGFAVTSRGQIVSTVAAAYTGAAAATDVITTRVSGDTDPRLTVDADGTLRWGSGSGAPTVSLGYNGGNLETPSYFVMASGQANGDFTIFGTNFTLGVAGGVVRVKEGTNASMGTATLVAGTVTVNTTKVTANSRIFLSAQTTGAAPGALRVSARTAGTSFTITSTSGTDTSAVAWWIVEPAP